MYSAIFLSKRQYKITFRTMLINFYMKNIKMKSSVALFKERSMKWYLFLKVKSQTKAYIINTVVCCLRKRKDVNKTVKKKIGKSFFQLICFIFYLSFKNNTCFTKVTHFYCLLSIFYLCFLRSSY